MPRLQTSQAGILRLYQPFLWLYPAEFRDEYRRELCLAFVDRWREERSITGLLFVWFHAILGIFYQAPREQCLLKLQGITCSANKQCIGRGF
ncbi:MAG TPA: hypothetical protein VIX91_03720 [Candidatus Acidoferrum sp.]